MRTEPTEDRIRRLWKDAAQDKIDPEKLWMDQSIEPEELVEIDPLDITPEMVDAAEEPELDDQVLQNLPRRGSSLRWECMAIRMMKAHLRAMHKQHPQRFLDDWTEKSREEGSV